MSFVTQSSCICLASLKWGMGAQNWSVAGSRPEINHGVRGGERPQFRRPAAGGAGRQARLSLRRSATPGAGSTSLGPWADDLSWSSQRRRRASKSLIRSCATFRSSGVWLIADLRERLKTCPGAYHPRKSGCCRRRRLSCRAANCATSVECRRHDPHAPGRTVRTYLLHDLALIEVVMRGPCLFHANARRLARDSRGRCV